MDDRPKATGSNELDVEDVSILLIGSEEEQNEAIRLIDKHLRRPILAKIRQSAPGLASGELPDVYQDVLLSILEAARQKRYDADQPLLPFVFTVAYRRAIDRIRNSSRGQAAESELLDAVRDRLADTKVGEAWKNVVAQEDGRRMMESIRNAIAAMPERQRHVAAFVIEHFSDVPTMQEIQQQILERTGEHLTVVAVKRAWQEALQKIREQLVRGGYMGRHRNGAAE